MVPCILSSGHPDIIPSLDEELGHTAPSHLLPDRWAVLTEWQATTETRGSRTDGHMVPASSAEDTCYCQGPQAAGKTHELLLQWLLLEGLSPFSLCLGFHYSHSCQLLNHSTIHQIHLIPTTPSQIEKATTIELIHCIYFNHHLASDSADICRETTHPGGFTQAWFFP